MKISMNWLKKYVKIPETMGSDALIRLIGARLVEVEGVIDETHKYDNIYIVKVETAEKIPDTHLTLCQINVGERDLAKVEKNENGLVQVVCGAPNVRAGMLAVWIAPGAIVPASVHEAAPFVIGKRKMLGKYVSNGMLAGADELDFGDKHDKIAEIDPVLAQPGDLFADVFELNDLILEIENKSLTHRPDCFGIIGFAREVAGILGQKFDEPEFLLKEEVFPENFLVETSHGMRHDGGELEIEITDSELCPRYTGALIKVTEATKQSKYLSEREILLYKSGMQSVSEIVDITNYLMLLTGQPLHAFDFDKFLAVSRENQAKVIVRRAEVGESLELIDGKTVECNKNDILITANGMPVALAGAMGGKNTEIDENTKRVLVESASFSLYNLRKTQMAHGIFSEAITRFTKGVPAGCTFNVLAEAVREMNGKVLDVVDEFPGWQEPTIVKISSKEINALLGTEYTYDKIEQTLTNVGFEISCDCGKKGKCECEEINITAPIWRTDIHIKEDIIEEVGRLLGYDNIAPTLPLHGTAKKDEMFELKRRLRSAMARLGANEVLTYSFVSGKLMEWAGQDVRNAYRIVNSISPDLQYVRQSLVPSLLDKAHLNQKLPVNQFVIYEMNKVYQKVWGMNDEAVPVEKNHFGCVVAERKNPNTAYYLAKKYVAKMLAEVGVAVEYVPLRVQSQEAAPFEPRRAAEIVATDGTLLGIVGEFKNSVRSEFKLMPFLAGFEVDLAAILERANNKSRVDLTMRETRDLTVLTEDTYAAVVEKIQSKLSEQQIKVEILPLGIYQPEGDNKKHISVRLEFAGKVDDAAMAELETLDF